MNLAFSLKLHPKNAILFCFFNEIYQSLSHKTNNCLESCLCPVEDTVKESQKTEIVGWVICVGV